MTTKYVSYCTSAKPECSFVPDAEIIICLKDSALVVQPVPPCDVEITTINATICSASALENACQKSVYYYKFAYDDAQIVDVERGLVSTDIESFICEGCLTTYIREQISCAVSSLMLSLEIVKE